MADAHQGLIQGALETQKAGFGPPFLCAVLKRHLKTAFQALYVIKCKTASKPRLATRFAYVLKGRAEARPALKSGSALARFETRVTLVDHVDATLAAHDDAVLVAIFRRLE